MGSTRKAGLYKILLIMVAMAPIGFLIGQRVTGREILEKPQETKLQVQNPASPDIISATRQATSSRSTAAGNPDHAKFRTH